MAAKDIPDWAVAIIENQAKVIEQNTAAISTMNSNFPKFIDALNSKFDAHNADTKALCVAVECSNKQQEEFRTQQWTRMWGLIEKVVIAAVLVLGGTYGGAELLKVLTGMG